MFFDDAEVQDCKGGNPETKVAVANSGTEGRKWKKDTAQPRCIFWVCENLPESTQNQVVLVSLPG
jgi:hypothetical protein